MDKDCDLAEGRYLLFLDILGFSELVKTKGVAEVLSVINETLQTFDRWEKVSRSFKTIYFSDTFLFYQEQKMQGEWDFTDIYCAGGNILTALLAKGIAARGAITFGEFEVYDAVSGKHPIYFGAALIEARQAEQKESWIGITIQPSAWLHRKARHPSEVNGLEKERVWIKRNDDVLLLNPFLRLRGWCLHDRSSLELDLPNFYDEILAFKFLHETANAFAEAGDFTGRVASKYHATIRFLRHVFGEDFYSWVCEISERPDLQGNLLPFDNE